MMVSNPHADSRESSEAQHHVAPPLGNIEAPRPLSALEWVLMSLAVLIALALLVGLPASLAAQYSTYRAILDRALSGAAVDAGAMLSLARAWDFAIVKTTSLFLAFLLVFLGGAHVLRASDATFRLRVQQPGAASGSLESSSPGLVMVVLGVALVIAVLYARTWVQYEPGISPAAKPSVDVPAQEFK